LQTAVVRIAACQSQTIAFELFPEFPGAKAVSPGASIEEQA
jgi:hypothetical protein